MLQLTQLGYCPVHGQRCTLRFTPAISHPVLFEVAPTGWDAEYYETHVCEGFVDETRCHETIIRLEAKIWRLRGRVAELEACPKEHHGDGPFQHVAASMAHATPLEEDKTERPQDQLHNQASFTTEHVASNAMPPPFGGGPCEIKKSSSIRSDAQGYFSRIVPGIPGRQEGRPHFAPEGIPKRLIAPLGDWNVATLHQQVGSDPERTMLHSGSDADSHSALLRQLEENPSTYAPHNGTYGGFNNLHRSLGAGSYDAGGSVQGDTQGWEDGLYLNVDGLQHDTWPQFG